MDFSFKNDFSPLYIFAALILSFLISYYYYKNSRIEGFQKKLFTALRFVSLFLLFLLLSSPVISLVRIMMEDPVNVFLIDNSQSLQIENRNESLIDDLSNRIPGATPSGSDNFYFLFSGNLNNETEPRDFKSIPFSGINNFETNLAATVASLQEKFRTGNLSSVTVISDGIINAGGNPVMNARQLGVPFNYILTGDTIQKKDLVLKNIFFNRSAFIESNVPVRAEINSFGFDKNVKINLYEEGNLISSKDLQVTEKNTSYNIDFTVVSPVEKITRYKVEVEGSNDEITLKNNSQEFFIKFINNKFKVLVISGGPSADFAFISGELKKINNFELTFLTQKSANEFYEGRSGDIENYDAYFLIGYPTSLSNQDFLNELKSEIEKNSSPLIFFASRNTDYRKLSVLDDLLPFKTISLNDAEQETGIEFVNIPDNEIFRNINLMQEVKSFPNIFISKNDFEIASSSETFLIATANTKPALVIQNSDRKKTAAFLAYGLHRWRMNEKKNNSSELLNYMLANMIASITKKDEKKNFDVTTSKQVYSKYENVRFEARTANTALGDTKVKIRISGTGFGKEIELEKKSSGFYEGEVNIPDDGDYTYTGELLSGGNLSESVQNRIAVGENNFEYKVTKADGRILKQLSLETGGRNFTGLKSSEIKDSLISVNKNSEIEYKRRKNIELYTNPYVLALIIFLLCLEWFLRKRNSLP